MATRGSTTGNQAGKSQPTRSGRQARNNAGFKEESQVQQARGRQQQASKQNGTSRRRDIGRPDVTFWPSYLLAVAFLAADEEGRKDLDTVICNRCAALVIGGANSQKAHKGFHDQVDGIDQRVS
jgi:hypothetical protein